MNKRCYGSKFLFWGALMLLVWSGYELYVRADAMAGPLRMFVDMAVGERIPIGTVLGYVDWTIFETPLYLAACALLGLFALCLRKKPLAALFLIPASVCAGLYKIDLSTPAMPDLWRLIGLVPLAFLLLGCVINLFSIPSRRAERARERETADERRRKWARRKDANRPRGRSAGM